MNLGAAFIFDAETENALREIWQSIADAGLPSFMLAVDYPPHMTIFSAEATDVPGMRQAFQELAATQPPLPVSFLSLAHFLDESGSVAYLAPIVNRPLLDLHAAIWRAADPITKGRPAYYAPGVWVPHVTVAYNTDPDRVGPVAAVLARARPLTGTISGILFGTFIVEGGSQTETVLFTG